jgi:hypothetical protein
VIAAQVQSLDLFKIKRILYTFEDLKNPVTNGPLSLASILREHSFKKSFGDHKIYSILIIHQSKTKVTSCQHAAN